MLQDVINTAYAADEAFERAIKSAGFKSRWEHGTLKHPAVLAAYRAKVEADEAMHQAFVASRKTDR